jgi:hypothetical protein
LALTVAAAPEARGAKSALLPPAQVLRIALRVARADGEPHPRNIALASGHLVAAVKVFDPHAHPTAAGLGALGGAGTRVDLVAMRGHFTSHGPHPHNRPEPKGTVLELLMNAHSGVVFGVSLGPKLAAPLSRLGAVTQLR